MAGDRTKIIRCVAIVFLVSISLRLAWVAFALATPTYDCRSYHILALGLINKGTLADVGYIARRPPVYPVFLAGIISIFGSNIKIAGFFHAILGGISSALIVILASHITTIRSSFIAGLLYSIYPFSIIYTPLLASENLAIPLLLNSALFLLISIKKQERRHYFFLFISGVSYGLLILTRPAAIFFFPGLLLFILHSRKKTTMKLKSALAFVIIVLVVLAPWFIRNYKLGFGPFTLSTTGSVNMWMANNYESFTGGFCGPALLLHPLVFDENTCDEVYTQSALTWIINNPIRYLDLCRIRAFRILFTEADIVASRYLFPTAENDRILREAYYLKNPQQIIKRRELQTNNSSIYTLIRAFIAPILFISLIFSFFNLRKYAIVIFTVISYLLFLSLSFYVNRLIELAIPLLIILVGPAISDILFDTRETGGRLPRIIKSLVVVLSTVAIIYLNATGELRKWYVLSPMMPDIQEVISKDIDLTLLARKHPILSDEDTQLSRDSRGLVCKITSGQKSKTSRVKIRTKETKAIRLEMSLINPSNIEAVYIDGFDKSMNLQLRWAWGTSPLHPAESGHKEYILIPGMKSIYFRPQVNKDTSSVRELCITTRVMSEKEAGFIIHRISLIKNYKLTDNTSIINNILFDHGLGIDLNIESIKFKPQALSAGDSLSIKTIITNNGVIPCKPTLINLALAPKGTYSIDKTKKLIVLQILKLSPLKIGESKQIKTSFELPEAITPGKYKLVVIVDPKMTTNDVNYDNNLKSNQRRLRINMQK